VSTPVPMFLLISKYLVGIKEVEGRLPQHGAWVEKGYEDGRILLSGRLVPPEGGAIVARGDDREEVEKWIEGDPFHVHGIAEYQVFELGATDFPRRSEAFDAFVRAYVEPA
jgi:uncharacterized protein YciI